MNSRMEITRTVSLLRSILRSELEGYDALIETGDTERLRAQLSEAHDKLIRAINVLNRLRA